jgi:Type VI secretion system effector, Hcp
VGIRPVLKAAALVAVGVVGGAAAVAVATVPDSSGVIHACVKVSGTVPDPSAPNVRVIDPSAGQQCSPAGVPAGPETALNWNVTGPPGTPGTPGAPGPPGANGRSVTLAGGNTFTISGGQVITVGRSPGLTLAAPRFTGGDIARLTFTGGVTLSTDITGISFPPNTGAGKAKIHDIQVTRHFDKASSRLALACANGTHIKTAIITVGKSGKKVEYDLSDLLIASYQMGSGHGNSLGETFTLSYTKISIKYSK